MAVQTCQISVSVLRWTKVRKLLKNTACDDIIRSSSTEDAFGKKKGFGRWTTREMKD